MSNLLFDPVAINGLPNTDRVVLTSRGNYFLIRMTRVDVDINNDGIDDQMNIKTSGWQCDELGVIDETKPISGNVESINLDAIANTSDAENFILETISSCVFRAERMVSARAVFNLIPTG